MRTLPESCEFGLAPKMIISMLEFSVGRIVSNEKSFSDFQRGKSPELAGQLRAFGIVYCGANFTWMLNMESKHSGTIS